MMNTDVAHSRVHKSRRGIPAMYFRSRSSRIKLIFKSKDNIRPSLTMVLARCAAAILLIVAGVKLVSAFSGARYLAYPDPVLGFVSNKVVLQIAAASEVLLAGILMNRPGHCYAHGSLLALCCSFITYRAGLAFTPGDRLCPCLGRAEDWMNITPKAADDLAVAILAILLGSSLICLWLGRLEVQSTTKA